MTSRAASAIRRGFEPASLVAAIAALALTGQVASAQVAIIDPDTGKPTEASAATTIMLDQAYLARMAVEDEAYIVPLAGPGRGVVSSNPGAMKNYFTVRTAPDGKSVAECRSAAEYHQGNVAAAGASR